MTSAPQDRASRMLAANLRALARVQPELARRVQLPVEGDHVRLDEGGRPCLAVGRGWVALELAASALEVESARESAESAEPAAIYVFGLGAGDQVAALLASHPRACITVWERDPWLLRLALGRRDWRRVLEVGRLRLRLGRDLLEDLRAGLPPAIVFHPLLAELYAAERRMLERCTRDPRECGRPVAALGLGELFVDDVAEALDDCGFAVLPLDFARWSLEELRESLAAADAQLAMTINYRDGLAEFCESAGIPLVCWEIDPTTDRDVRLQARAPAAHVFTWRRANVETYRAAGCGHVEHLALASNVRRHAPPAPKLSSAERAELKGYAAPVAFVGASMVARAAQLRRRFVELHTALLPEVPAQTVALRIQVLLDAQRRDGATYVLPELAAHSFAEFFAALEASEVRDDPVLLLAESAAAERRLGWAAGIARYGLHVWGDADWARIEPYGATYRGPAGHRIELSKIYGAARVQVDIGRLYQRDIVSMRVFDVLACGGFLIAEHSADLEELFEVGCELESYRTPAELERKIAHYLAHPDQARGIAAAGLRAVRERHTIRQRVETMLAALAPRSAAQSAG